MSHLQNMPNPSWQKMIQLNNISHSFGQSEIFCKLSLTIHDQSIHAIVGETGVGKTLLLKMIAGLIQVQEGEIFKNSHRVSFVFQQNALFPWLNLKDNLELTTGKSEEELFSLLEKFRLLGFMHMFPREISGGTVQKFNLLRAFLSPREIILLDEPFSHLDFIQRESLYEFMFELWHESKRTIVMVTHDIDEALLLSHQISYLSKSSKNIEKTITVREKHLDKLDSLTNVRSQNNYQQIFANLYSSLKKDIMR